MSRTVKQAIRAPAETNLPDTLAICNHFRSLRGDNSFLDGWKKEAKPCSDVLRG